MRFDVVVVGAGPAGSATAALLAQRGFAVALIERAVFPRPKPCAEYIGPGALRTLDRLLPPGTLEAEGAVPIRGMRIVTPDGTAFVGRFAGAHPVRGDGDSGVALPRERLDELLATAAAARGVTLIEGATAESAGEPHAHGRRVPLRSGRRRWTVEGRIVIAADGLNSRIARDLGLTRRGRRRQVALVSHVVRVAGVGDLGEMHVTRFGYVGLAPLGDGLVNVAAVADLGRTAPRGRPAEWLRRLLAGAPALSTRLAAARFVTPVRAVGPFARWTARATADRVLLVGDAADFYDPFTGAGIYAALRGAELASGVAARALAACRAGARDLAPYDRARRRAFGGKWIVERVVGAAVARPAVLNHVGKRLAAQPRLADLLVGVTAELVPPAAILHPVFAWKLLG